MAAVAIPDPHLDPHGQTCIRDSNNEVFQKLHSIIVDKTGHPAISYAHLYDFMIHVDQFIHPNPRPDIGHGPVRMRALPTMNGQNAIQDHLQGWAGLTPQETNQQQQIFNRFTDEDLHSGYSKFFLRQGRAPTVCEFSRYLLTFEGNDQTDTSRKTLGKLFLENEEFKQSLLLCTRSVEMLKEMMDSKDIINNILSQANQEKLNQIQDLQRMKLHLQQVLTTVQQDRTQLQLDKNELTLDNNQLKLEVDLFKTETQRLTVDKNMLVSENVRLQTSVTEMEDEQNRLIEIVNMLQDRIITSIEQTLEQVDDKIHMLQQENIQLKQSLHTVQNDNTNLQQTLHTVQNDNTNLQQENTDLQQTLHTVQNDNVNLTKNFKKYRNDYKHMRSDNVHLQEENTELRQKLASAEQTCQQVIYVKDNSCVQVNKELQVYKALLFIAFLLMAVMSYFVITTQNKSPSQS